MSATTTALTAPPSGVPPLTRPEMGLAGIAALAAAGVGALGLISSFDAVSAAAARWGFGEPWMLPVGIDVAIPVFTVANLLLIRMDMALAWVRFVPWVLTLITCGLNVAAGQGMWAKVAHGTMPLLWVVFSEIGAHIYAARIGAATGRRMEKIRFSRWLLAFPSTFALWRRMTLWEVTSYSEALTREKERQLARADLRERYGRKWRSKTPRRERVMLRMGELAPASEQETPAVPPPVPLADPKPRPRRQTNSKAKGKPQRTFEELLTEARTATAEWADSELTADRIRTAVHVSQANARKLRDLLQTERGAGRPLHSVDDSEGDGTAVEAA
ncbi:DUF2637 domain-containing protein [Streptomyces europaeiscabiei]|uniref:DUF2637 domain-containing protein n=1 Tax=Streptomyces TaxID=1883 RepID=UPI00211B12A5|nr:MULTISPECIES: DUF2637 domain-containing protein [Streptomyces]MDX3631691.1 DUF2637 domain-containing protein [Streptomyces europaeiscabiei]MDX3649472.1 DUF2637 domain-containing protein [Streptomyces europaeiscabiei]WUD34452.1 DUF2637 domain-containing protein [Streptomyces europaeiscabiei]